MFLWLIRYGLMITNILQSEYFLTEISRNLSFLLNSEQQDSHECMLNIFEELEKNIIDMDIDFKKSDECEKKEWYSIFKKHNF